MIENTLSIIKPNAMKKNVIGEIMSRFEKNDLKIVATRMKNLSKKEAEGFYAEHKGKHFFDGLVEFMMSEAVMLIVLRGENAIAKNRELMGATNFKDAKAGTIRADFADGFTENAVHGSDSPESANREISYFFSKIEIYDKTI